MIHSLSPPEYRRMRVEPSLLVNADGRRIESLEAWEEERGRLEADWRAYLGASPFPDLEHNVQEHDEEDLGEHIGRRVNIQTEPGYFEECYLLVPKERRAEPRPAVVIFYYDVETPAGLPRDGAAEVRQFARHLTDRGYVTLTQRWFHEGYVNRPRGGQSLQARYSESVARFQRLAPNWKGLGRVVWDATRCVDYLSTLEYVDQNRIACMGHSLGGKMSLYAAAFESRFKAVIASDLGIGLPFSNWEAPWYLGPEVQESSFTRDHHQLLGLIAPRPFLLIAGESSDGKRSWPYLNSAQDVYRLYGNESAIAMFNHGTGHTPTQESIDAAYAWLDEQLAP